ncbi:LysR family transcriptional regulator [Hoeflea poritis]|uniref:LysR family transcriptional regulator n=1 Tax=Hoeflea poritis TaxID=2993659 RepID=A0ABT4VIQ2_9HYPH|nr:LysR family transcriptional regulator [Hoeflea poritis]MDA4844540.1 LysR family transcriptional regulator [Hoeflea poritis]
MAQWSGRQPLNSQVQILARRLPQTSLLETFEAAARRGSFTLAAADLNMTQGAVSRQIRALEEQLGTELFIRERQRITLSPAGAAYLEEISRALSIIRMASTAMKVNPDGGVLNLGILPTFGTRWLAPRLPDFFRRHPGITVNLTTKLRPFDFGSEMLDAAIHFGADEWPGTEHLFLAEETVVLACSPTLLPQLNIETVEDVAKGPLLHLATRPMAWQRWFEMNGLETDVQPGTTFDQFATMAQAAAHGLGLALLPEFLIEDELRSGKLVAAWDKANKSIGSYALIWPKSRRNHPPLLRFREWLETAVGQGIDGNSR